MGRASSPPLCWWLWFCGSGSRIKRQKRNTVAYCIRLLRLDLRSADSSFLHSDNCAAEQPSLLHTI
eukprot:scaffold2901_cov91-Skeletonema_dohrnii-CCMP3373.AAC.10